MEILIKAGQLLLALSILVTLHELGHYWAARLFKIRVEKFYLFFDFLFPLPSVMKFSIFKKKIKDTEWGIGWFPMGGYVQIAGMMDESMDKETLAQEPKPDEFRSKPAWQRLIVMLGGVLVNFFLGIFIYCMIMWIWGEKYLPNSSLKHGLYADTLAQSIGLRNGDMILKADNDTLVNYLDIVPTIGINQAKTLLVKRGDSTFTLPIPAGFHGKLTASQGEGFIDFRREFIVLDINGGAAVSYTHLRAHETG
jgi:regulator of sigma E protease